VSGYGLETATMAMQIQSILKAMDGSGIEPLNCVNQYLYKQLESINLNLFCKVLSVQMDQNTLSLVGSGEPPIKFGNEQPSFVELSSMLPLGISDKLDFKPVQISMLNGEAILLFSTGFKNALAKLNGLDAEILTASKIIELSGILKSNSSHILDEIKQQTWFESFQQDISFILIHCKGSL